MDYSSLVDKYRVKAVVAPYFRTAETYAVVRRTRDVDVGCLPPTYVMKATCGWNMALLVVDNVIHCSNRDDELAGQPATTPALRAVADGWLRRGPPRHERQYRFARRAVLFEEFIQPIDHELQLLFFHGVCRAALTLESGFNRAAGVRYRLYDQDWHQLAASEGTETADRGSPRPPPDLLAPASRMASAFDHVRMDFLVSGGSYRFAEFTFTHNAGKPDLFARHGIDLARFWTR